MVRDGRDRLFFHGYWTRFLYRRGISRKIDALLTVYGLTKDHGFQLGDVVIDVGANIGEFTIGVARRGATVHAFEPDPVFFSILKKNTAQYANVALHQIALWNEDTTKEFYSSPANDDSSLIRPSVAIECVYQVAARSLDSFCAERNIGNVVLLKCEAEGAEPEVLEGATSVLQRTKMVVVDCSPERYDESPYDAVVALLTGVGFQTTRLLHDGVDSDIGRTRLVVVATRTP